ncbi:all development altered-6 [Diaporthe helianthi]|uniref:All development altered-6 n=1 Tax=Diaporthe helianthi TaxID=158607 RepID=A0A2P5HI19_DIAHE|nr:all development altered-6 [Diaporthe helianthi]
MTSTTMTKMQAGDSSTSKTTQRTRPRQKPGAACEECRRRKLRCDRRQPQCGSCQSTGVPCHTTTVRAARGPKPGYLKDLKARIAALEGTLIQQAQQQQQQQQQAARTTSSDEDASSCYDPYLFNRADSLKIPHPVTEPDNVFLPDMASGNPIPNGLEQPLGFPCLGGTAMSPTPPLDSSLMSPPLTAFGGIGFEPMLPNGMHASGEQITSLDLNNMRRMSSTSSCWSSADGASEFRISPMIQADLDQIYWDWTHLHVPIIHQRRYMAWSRKQDKSGAQKCLQLAMWTLAASTSPGQYQSMANFLYRYASQSLLNLESWDSGDEWSQMRPNDFAQVQAQLLLALYEFKCVDFRRGWMRAGRAFRLIQLNWFYDILSTSSTMSDWVEAEQRRRTFWVAFCLDRTISLRNDAPCTFNEPIYVPLPAPDAEFQNEIPTVTGYLNSDSLTVGAADSVLSDLIRLAAICGKAVSHRHQSIIDKALGVHNTAGIWQRHREINAQLAENINCAASRVQSTMKKSEEPLAPFLEIVCQTVILHLHSTLSCTASTGKDEYDYAMVESMQRGTLAAQDALRCVERLSQCNSLQLHPIMIVPLAHCSELMEAWPDLAGRFNNHLAVMMDATRRINNGDTPS